MKNKPSILFVSNFLGDGGAARVITVLAEGFMNKGYEVSICSFANKQKKEYPRVVGIEYISLNTQKSGWLKKLERIWLLRKEIKRHSNAVIISFEYFMNMQAVVATLGLRNHLIVSERNDPARMGGKFPTRVIRNYLYRFCDMLVCQTENAKDYFPIYIKKKTEIIMNPIKENLPEPWKGERTKEIVNFCRLEKQKNLKLLIDAFERFSKNHTEYKLLIYGDGREKETLEQYVLHKRMHNQIIIHNSVENIHERILRSAMFVSSSDYEGLSNSMIEAMAIGLPTICTDCPCGGARMVIQDGVNGLLVPVEDVDEMVNAMNVIVSDTELAKRLAQNSVEIKKTLSVNNIIDKWEKLLEYLEV